MFYSVKKPRIRRADVRKILQGGIFHGNFEMYEQNVLINFRSD